jgi:hypothetical protein
MSKPPESVNRCHQRSVLQATSQSSFPYSALSNGSPLSPGGSIPGTFHLRRFSRPWRFASSAALQPYFMLLALLGFSPILRPRVLFGFVRIRITHVSRRSPSGLSTSAALRRFDSAFLSWSSSTPLTEVKNASWTSRVLPATALATLERAACPHGVFSKTSFYSLYSPARILCHSWVAPRQPGGVSTPSIALTLQSAPSSYRSLASSGLA